MKQEKDFIEVPFGARDSELGGFEYTIPQGFEAEIKDGKVIVIKTESEDEKIRKAIVWCIDTVVGELGINEPEGLSVSKLKSWLKKQGEQKPVECCADKLWTEFKKQVAYLMASSYNREYEYTKGYVEWVAQSLLGYAKNEIEQNHVEWSEEDEKEVAVLEAYIRSRDWSDRHIDRALGIVDELVNKVKSLKERYTWKPSDEQMKFLQKYAEQNNYDGSILTSLYQDLRKRKK